MSRSDLPLGATDTEPRAEFIPIAQDQVIALGLHRCRRVFVSPVRGAVTAASRRLDQADVLTIKYPSKDIELRGEFAGTLVAVAALPLGKSACERPGAEEMNVTRGAGTAPVAWADGAMRAWLDVEAGTSPEGYFGRLQGSASVPLHEHASSWELLFAIDAHGTFTLDGRAERIDGASVVRVPPGSKHQWVPDAESALTAVQVYFPPGPEQRFKAFARGNGDAGTDVGGAGPLKKKGE